MNVWNGMTKDLCFLAILLFFNACTQEEYFEAPEVPKLDLVVNVLSNHQQVSGQWTIDAKDSYGKVRSHWEGSLSGSQNNITIDAIYELYEITVKANGISRNTSVTLKKLKELPEVTISLYDDVDYHIYSTYDGNITLFLPRDPTNPFYEVRVGNPSKIAYCILDRAFWKDGIPVHDMLYTVITGSEVNETTFAAFVKFKGEYGITWNAADSKLSYLSTENKYEEILHEWEF